MRCAKIAALLRGGMIPMAYVYPSEMKATRDLLRRRNHLVRKRADLLAHIQNTNHQYNLPRFKKVIAYRRNRDGIAEQFSDECVRKSIEVNTKKLFANLKLIKTQKITAISHSLQCLDMCFFFRCKDRSDSVSTLDRNISVTQEFKLLLDMRAWR